MISRFRKILSPSFLGYRLVAQEEYKKSQESLERQAVLIAKNIELENKIKILIAAIEDLKKKVEVAKSVYGFEVDPFLGDPTPIDLAKRKAYVAQVAALYNDILEPKIRQMISQAHSMLDDASNDREYDQAVKGCVYALKEMMRWGKSMVNEQLTYQTGDNPSLPDIGVNNN